METRTTDKVADNVVVRAMARTGYLAKGIVYLLIGWLALMVVFGERRALPGAEAAVRTIGEQPFGQVLLIAAAIGLVCYALWRAVQVVLDPDGARDPGHRVLVRTGYALSGISYGALGVLAFQLATGGSGHGHAERTFVAECLRMDGGEWIVGALGAIVVIYALHQIHVGWTSEFMRQLRTEQMSPGEQRAAWWSGRVGIVARGVVFVMIGIGIVRAAIEQRSSEATGVGGVLAELASKPFGMVILALVAIGLALYGLHQLVLARYRRIPQR
jgi:hypothetical protein